MRGCKGEPASHTGIDLVAPPMHRGLEIVRRSSTHLYPDHIPYRRYREQRPCREDHSAHYHSTGPPFPCAAEVPPSNVLPRHCLTALRRPAAWLANRLLWIVPLSPFIPYPPLFLIRYPFIRHNSAISGRQGGCTTFGARCLSAAPADDTDSYK
jgi:hypothetical protein